MTEVTASVSAWKVDFLPLWGMNISKYVQHYVDNILPSHLDSTENIEKYLTFIRHFGTHYFTSGKFGGVIKMDFLTKSDYFKFHSDKELHIAAKVSFKAFLKASGEWKKSDKNIFSNFTSLSTVFTR